MTNVRKVVMAAVAGSMLMGSMPTMCIEAGIIKSVLGGLCVVLGLGGSAVIEGTHKGYTVARMLSAAVCAGGALFLKTGLSEKASAEKKKMADEIRREVLNSMKSGDSLKNQRR